MVGERNFGYRFEGKSEEVIRMQVKGRKEKDKEEEEEEEEEEVGDFQ